MNAVYVVHGRTGHDDEEDAWFVCAYGDREQALLHAGKANEWLRDEDAFDDGDAYVAFDDRQRLDGKNPFDPNFHLQMTGARYHVTEVSFYLHLDQFLGAP